MLHAAADRVLKAAATGIVDSGAIAGELIGADLAAGFIDEFVACRSSTQDRYRTIVMRALSTLVATGTIDDRGDHPSAVRLGPADVAPVDEFAAAVAAFAADGPKVVPIDELHDVLAAAGHPSVDVSDLWAALVGLFNAGTVDVSVASPTWRTSVTFPGLPVTAIPAEFDTLADLRTVRARTELVEMRAWFEENTRCANEGLADYFATTLPAVLPADVCSTPGCRCLSCWGRDGRGESREMYEALMNPQSRPAGTVTSREQALDRAIATLLYDNSYGLHQKMIWRVLRGEETRWNPKLKRPVSLPRRLLYHRLFNSKPGLRDEAVVAAMNASPLLTSPNSTGMCGVTVTGWTSTPPVPLQHPQCQRAGRAVSAS